MSILSIKEHKHVSTEQLNNLFTAIGWKARESVRWKEVLEKSTYLITFWDESNLVGMGRILEDGVMCMFYDIGVHPDYQNKGIGKQIMEKLIGQVRGKDYVSIGLFPWHDNPSNIPFYEKLGFVKVSGMELENYMKRE